MFVKDYEFLSFSKYIGKDVSKNISGKYSQKPLDHVKQSATNVFKTASKTSIQKTAEATRNLIDNRIADKIKQSFKKVTKK